MNFENPNMDKKPEEDVVDRLLARIQKKQDQIDGMAGWNDFASGDGEKIQQYEAEKAELEAQLGRELDKLSPRSEHSKNERPSFAPQESAEEKLKRDLAALRRYGPLRIVLNGDSDHGWNIVGNEGNVVTLEKEFVTKGFLGRKNVQKKQAMAKVESLLKWNGDGEPPTGVFQVPRKDSNAA